MPRECIELLRFLFFKNEKKYCGKDKAVAAQRVNAVNVHFASGFNEYKKKQ